MTSKIKFLRRNTGDYSKLGRKRKKLQKWRSPKGRDNKMRLREKSKGPTVEIGYKQDKKTRGKVDGKEIVLVKSVKELEAVKKDSIIMIAKIGKKNRIAIAEKAKEKNLKIKNLDVEKFLKENVKAVEETK